MFWGLTLEVGKQYTQIVEEGFHITRATLDPLTIKGKEGEGDVHLVYILRLRHNKQDYILCTLEPGKQYSEPLDLSFSEGEEVSFFLEGSDEGTLHLTGYLEELQSMPPEEVMLDSDMEEMSSEEEGEEEESSEEEEVPNGLSLHALTAGDELEEESEEEWAPNSGNSKKRKRAGVAEKGKKKRKKSASSTSTSTSTPSTGEEEDEDEELSDELDDEEESDEFDSEDDDEEDDDDDEEESEEEEEEDSEEGESAMDGVRGVLNFEENEMSDSASGEDSEEEESETTHSEPSTPGDTPEVKGKKPQQKSNKKGQGQKTVVKQQKNETPAGESLTGKKKKPQQQGKTDDDKTAEKGGPQTKKEKETPKTKVVNGEAPKSKEQTQTASQKKKNKRKSGKEFQDGATTQNPASEQAAGPNSNKKKAATPAKQVLPGGLVVIDRELGAGKVAKAGRRVGMYYKGTLAQNNKNFDSRQNGKPFTFTLGHGEVIKGWDMGVQGMKIGGKRRLEIPPALAYGSQRVGPIPANSKLIFEVELKSVS